MVITGEPGVGKSFLVQQTCFELAEGRRWLGLFKSRKIRTVYCEFEKRSPIAEDRFVRDHWIQEYGDAINNVGYFNDSVLNPTTEKGMDALRDIVVTFGCKLLVLDSMSITIPDESYDNPAVKTAVNNLRNLSKEQGLGIILIQHLVKRQTGFNTKTGEFVTSPLRLDELRGAKTIMYEVDTVVGLLHSKQKRIRELCFLKHAHSPIPFDEYPPLKFDYYASTAVPLMSDIKGIGEILRIVDSLDGVTITELETLTEISKPTIYKAVDFIETMGLAKVRRGKGRGIDTILYQLKY